MAVMRARFHSAGATYDTKKRRWLSRMPIAHAERTKIPTIGKRIRTSVAVRRCLSGDHSGKKSWTTSGAARTPTRTTVPATTLRMPNAAPAKRAASSSRPCSTSSA